MSVLFAIKGTRLVLQDSSGYDPWVPILPQLTVDTTLPTGWDGTADATPADTAAFQTALDNAVQNDGVYIIQLTAGNTYTGPFKVNAKAGSDWLIIRSSAYASLPAVGTRIAPADASDMATVRSTGTGGSGIALWHEWGSHHIRYLGIEFEATHATTSGTANMIVACGYDPDQNDHPDAIEDQSSYIIFDRCYVHGTATGNSRQGIQFDASYGAVIDSYIADIHEVGADSQAIFIYQGAGPYKIDNNYLEGAGENFLAGGADPFIDDLVPSDITFTHNFVTKPLTWKADDDSYADIAWAVKNLFELKNARRVLVEGNIFERCWVMGQTGVAILFTVRNQDGSAPWCAVEDVTFRKNVVRDTLSGFNLTNEDNNHASENLKRVLIENNLILIDAEEFGDGLNSNFAFGFSVAGVHPAEYISVKHNTAIALTLCTKAATFGDTTPYATALRFNNNLCSHGLYGVIGTTIGQGTAVFTGYCTAFEEANNAFILDGQTPGTYDASTLFPADPAACGFADYDGGDYTITSGTLNNSASDGTDRGADIAALNAAIAGVEP